jgi:hypothetical protein
VPRTVPLCIPEGALFSHGPSRSCSKAAPAGPEGGSTAKGTMLTVKDLNKRLNRSGLLAEKQALTLLKESLDKIKEAEHESTLKSIVERIKGNPSREFEGCRMRGRDRILCASARIPVPAASLQCCTARVLHHRSSEEAEHSFLCCTTRAARLVGNAFLA